MNSIKNAIVTVTLLAVGYGSYVVLSEPLPSSPQTASTVAPEAGAADVTTRLDLSSPSVDLSSPSVDLSSPSVDVTSPSVDVTSPSVEAMPPNGNPFGSPANPTVTSDSLPDFAMSESPRSEGDGRSAVEAVTISPISPPVSLAPSAVGIEGVAEQAPTPSVQLTPSTPVQIQEPSHEGFPELPPLPEMMPNSQRGTNVSETLSSSDLSVPSDLSPLQGSSSVDTNSLLSPAVTADPSTVTPSGSPVQDSLQPPVGGVDAGFEKSPTYLAAPDQIDLQPDDTRPRPTPMLPPIDPSSGANSTASLGRQCGF